MITRRRLLYWMIGSNAVLGIIAGSAFGVENNRPQLPSISQYQNLPTQFNQALQNAHDKARASGNNPEDVRQLARLYQANRLYRAARSCYQLITSSRDGLTARDHYYLADIAQNENDLAGAQAELRATLQAEPGYIPARLALADTLFKTGQEDQAEKEYSAVLAIEANQPQASVGRARIDLQRGDDAIAVTRLEELVAAHPESTPAASLLAQVLGRRGETDRATALTQWSLQKPAPPLADPWMTALLADCYDIQRLSLTFEDYFKSGNTDQALPILDRLVALDPQGPTTIMFSGFAHARNHQDTIAVQEYYQALSEGGNSEKICPALVQSLLALGKVPEAGKLIQDHYEKMPDSLPLAKAYADVAVQQKDKKLARMLLENVLQKEPYLQSQNMSLAEILWTSGEREAAAKCLQRVALVYPHDVASRALLGEYYLGKSDPYSAIRPLEQADLDVTAGTPEQQSLTALLGAAYIQAGNGEAERGQLPEAIGYYEKAIRRSPTDLTGYAGKADVCVRLKQFRPAAEALEKMASLQPENPTIYLSLGDVVYQEGEADQARRHWQKARQLAAAGDSEIREALDLRLSGRISAETFK